MCGLVFAINNSVYTSKLDDWFSDAMVASQVRGLDSSGLFVLGKAGIPTLVKSALNASLFVEQKTTKDAIEKIPGAHVAVGHVRARTTGSISAANAHPFRIDRDDGSYVIGAHNGTLRTWRAKDDAEKFDVDSEWVFHMIAKHGDDAFKHFNGAFALIWYDSAKPNVLNMARNDERPLAFLISKSARTIIGCSEIGMLGWLSDKHGFKCHDDHPVPYYLSSGKIYEFDLNEIGAWKTRDFAAYDYTTSYVAPASQSMLSTYERESRWDDDGMDYWPAGSWRNQSGSASSWRARMDADYAAYAEEEQESVITGVKEALRQARYSLFRDKNDAPNDDVTIVEEEDLEAALHRAIADLDASNAIDSSRPAVEGEANDIFLKGGVTLGTVEPSTVTYNERNDAVTLAASGIVVRFKGLWYDEDTSEGWGTFDLIEGSEIITYEACIRMITQDYFESVFVKPKDGSLCVIVGVEKSVEWFIVEQLTHQQRRLVEDAYFMDKAKDYEDRLREAMH